MDSTINRNEVVAWLRQQNRMVFAALVNNMSTRTMIPTQWVREQLPANLMRELECNVTQTLKLA